MDKEIWIQGQPISEGIAIGVPFFLDASVESIPEFPITLGEVDSEIARYRHALVSSRSDLQEIEKGLLHEGSEDAAEIIASHIEMLEDPIMTTAMEEKIRQMLQNTESVFQTVIGGYAQKYSQMNNQFFQQRLIDVMDLAKRVLRHLCPDGKTILKEVPRHSIVFAHSLEPSYMATASSSEIYAFVTTTGGGSSHAAVIARAKGIPYVICPEVASLKEGRFASAIVDGQTGEVVLNPSPHTLQQYLQKKTSLKTHYQLLQKESHHPTETLDGKGILVHANIGHLGDLSAFKSSGADGIGLFRSEYLFLENSKQPPTEEFQYKVYKEVAEGACGKPLVMRVFDVGGDKRLDFLGPMFKEPNPMLGCRGIRFLLRYPLIFKTQLRALFRVAEHAQVKILLPFVTDFDELRSALNIIQEVKAATLPSSKKVPVGCMIEIPSAALIASSLAEEVDFFSIGSNDLFQYLLGIDRNNPVMGDAYSPFHPSMLKMLEMIVNASQEKNLPVCLCGEIASHPQYLPLLIGLGIREFSCSPRYVPVVKNAVRKVSFEAAEKLAERALSMKSSSAIAELISS